MDRNQEVAMVTARTAVRPQAGARTRAAPPHPGWVLAALLGAMFLGSVDIAVANIAGPAIRAGLHASGGELELVVSGYTLAYATLLVTCARLGEARGYRPMFLAGLAAFIAASLACGVAPNAPSLVAARVVAAARRRS
jgi:MFS family permease